ncbi:MAG: GLUG motif-containing protein, partial [Solirubrobacterales bacterium]
SWSDGAIVGGEQSHDLGGLVGTCFGVEIENCYASGDVTGGEASYCIGGLLGSCIGTAARNCYAMGTVSGLRTLGGFAGRVQTGSEIIHCHAVGRVLRGDKPWGQGGFAGRVDRSDVRVVGCFWDVETSQASASAAGVGLTADQMRDARVFRDAEWDLAGDPNDGTADLWLVPQEGRHPTLATFVDPCQPHVLEGAGNSSDPYLIATAEDLGAIGQYSRSAWYRLTADIDLAGETWSAPVVSSFAGVFDGHGHRIRSLTLRCDGRDHAGLFGRIEAGAWVYDLGLDEVSVVASGKSLGVGALTGENAGDVAGCYVTGTVAAEGGCRSAGGLVGVNWLGIIEDCYSVAQVRASAGTGQAGGLVGYNYMGTLANCYAAGRVSGEDVEILGGLAGLSSDHAETSSCYYLAASAGGGPDRGQGVAVTTEQMMQRATFVDWDFINTWRLCDGKAYPHLDWELFKCGDE